MSQTTTIKDCDIFTQKLAAVLTELKSLRSEFGGFGFKLDSIGDSLCKMANSVTALASNMSEVKRNVASNTTWMEEAENRIMSAEEHTSTSVLLLDA